MSLKNLSVKNKIPDQYNIKFRNKSTNKLELLHTLNGSGLATPRLMVALLETFQESNGKIKVPSILNKYINYE